MDEWFCMQCGKKLVKIILDDGEFPACTSCAIKYAIHGTGVDGSLFVAGAEVLSIKF